MTGDKTYIRAGWLIDGSGNPAREDALLTLVNGSLAAIDCFDRSSAPPAELLTDLSHCTLVPPLVDCSVTLSRSPSVDSRVRSAAEEAGPAKRTAMVEQHIRYCHAHGVLGVADSDDGTGLVERYQDGMAQGNIIDVRTSGRLCRSWQDCEVGAPAGGDFIKIGYSGNIEDEEAPHPRLNHEELCRILQRRGGKKVVVVANGPQQVAAALAAGCDAIEQGYLMGEDNLRKMAEKGVLWIPSVLRAKNALDGTGTGGEVCCRFSLRYAAPGKPVPGAAAFWKKMLAGQLAQLRLARELGVTTATGTGAGSVGILHGESMVEEMKLFIKAGYLLSETIRCASENGAGFFDMEKPGTLSVGRKATFLVTRGTVQLLPRKLAYLEAIYVDGAPSTAYQKNPSRR